MNPVDAVQGEAEPIFPGVVPVTTKPRPGSYVNGGASGNGTSVFAGSNVQVGVNKLGEVRGRNTSEVVNPVGRRAT